MFGPKYFGIEVLGMRHRPTIQFSVSGAEAGPELEGWIAESPNANLISNVEHVALRGRQVPKDLTWFDRMMLITGGLKNPDPVAGKEDFQGFDFLDKSSIEPIVEMVRQLEGYETTASRGSSLFGNLVPDTVWRRSAPGSKRS